MSMRVCAQHHGLGGRDKRHRTHPLQAPEPVMVLGLSVSPVLVLDLDLDSWG
jgi:hypothetical protein